MGREIRFRQFRDGRMIPIHTMYSDKSGSEPAESGNFNFIEDEILMQFTGLKDKNGVDIYEGDIVKWTTRRYKSVYTGNHEDRDKLISITWKSAVEWDMQSFCITESFDPVNQRNNSPLAPDSTLEVIGNIHQNPDLLC